MVIWVVVVRISGHLCLMRVLVSVVLFSCVLLVCGVFVSGHVSRHLIKLSGVRVGMTAVHITTELLTVARVGTRSVPVHGRRVRHARVTFVALAETFLALAETFVAYAVTFVALTSVTTVTLATHVAVVLLSTNIVVLIGLLGLRALSNTVSWGRLGHNGLNLGGLKPVNTVHFIHNIGLHLEHEAAILDESLRGAESC